MKKIAIQIKQWTINATGEREGWLCPGHGRPQHLLDKWNPPAAALVSTGLNWPADVLIMRQDLCESGLGQNSSQSTISSIPVQTLNDC